MNNIENRLLSSRYHEMDINEENEGIYIYIYIYIHILKYINIY
jgi:hypothetical protein